MIKQISIGFCTLFCASWTMAQPALADATYAYCEYIPNNAGQAPVSMPCIFSMRQGAVGITWQDGIHSRFVPENIPANLLVDELGGRVYRDNHAIEQGVRFEMEAGIINVYYGGNSGSVNWGNIDWELAPQTPWGL